MSPGSSPQARRARAIGLVLLVVLAAHIGYLVWTQSAGILRSFDYVTLPGESHLARRWKGDNFYQRVRFIAEQTPTDSLIILPSQGGVGAIGNAGLVDFFLFPRRTAHPADAHIATWQGPVYQVRLENTRIDPMPLSTAELDPTFAVALVRERRDALPLPSSDFVGVPPAWSTIFFALLKLGLITLSGAFLVLRIFQFETFPGKLAASLLVGMSVQTLGFIALSFLNVPLNETAQMIFLVLTAAPAIVYLVRHRPGKAREGNHGWPLPAATRDRATLAAAVVTTALLGVVFVVGVAKPIVEWDAAAIWGIKARVIFSTETLREIRNWGAWPEYPPLVPVAMAQLGVGGERVVKAIFPLIALCLYGVVSEGLAATGLPRWARLLLSLPLVFTPQLLQHAEWGYANLALAVYVTLAVLLLTRWLGHGDQRLAFAVAIALCGVILARPDGEVYAAYMILIAGGWFWVHKWSKRALLYLLLPIGADLGWKIFYALYLRNSVTGSLFGVASQGQQLAKRMLTTVPTLEHLSNVANHMLRYVFGFEFWGLIPLTLLVLVLLEPRAFVRRYPVECAFLGLALCGLMLLALYLAPVEAVTYYFNAVFLRLFMVVVPLMYLLVIRELARRFMPQAETRMVSEAVPA